MMKKPTIYISYSHKDADWKNRIREDISLYLTLNFHDVFDIWDDSRIMLGDDWEEAISKAWDSATIALILVSENYLTSSFAFNVEAQNLLKRRESQGLRLIPIIISPCDWQSVSWLLRIFVAPKGGRALSELPNDVAQKELDEISRAIVQILSSAPEEAKREESQGVVSTTEVSQTAEPALPLPSPPEDLIAACVAGECVLYGGAGLSAQGNFPPWVPFVRGLLDWAVRERFIPETDAASHRAAIDSGQANTVADVIVSAVEGNTEKLYAYIRSVFTRQPNEAMWGGATTPPLPAAHKALSRIQFSAIMTTNFDNLLEEAFKKPGVHIYTPRDAEPLLDALSKREFFILKLYGRLEQPETLMLASAQFEDSVRDNYQFAQFMETLFFSRTLLFIGNSLQGIEDYLKGVSSKRFSTSRRHYALVGVFDNAWQALASQMERRYGITVLPYTPSEGYPEAAQFLKTLADAVQAKTEETAKPISGTGDGQIVAPPVGRLKQIVLENIGPFEHLELNLDPKWNILLGDNGVGKSNILKALAVAIIGKDAQAFAGRFVRSCPGVSSGTIILQTDRETYRTEIRRKSGIEAEVISTPGRPLEAEGWLALGFPPLRTVSWERPKSPEATDVKRRPSPEDLLPLISGGVDPRTDKLKQWIVNLDYWNLAEQLKPGETAQSTGTAGRYGRLLDDFFQVVGRITEGLKVERGKVNAKTHEVTIVTDDGELPFEMVSQGTTSLIGWVGVLLQRLYEINPDDEDPKQRYALVLMDEIDAHLHPAWQQSMVYHLSNIFPNVQFIATTHSPLIVGGMPAHQVSRFVRDEDGKVVQKKINPDMTMGRADQILTTELFGLSTTLPKSTQEQMKKYHALLTKETRTSEEEEDYENLALALQFRIPAPTANYQQRREEALSDAALLKQLGEQFKDTLPQDGETIIKRADKLLSDLEGGNNK